MDAYEIIEAIKAETSNPEEVWDRVNETIKEIDDTEVKKYLKKLNETYAEDNDLCTICGEKMKPIIYRDGRYYGGSPCYEEFMDLNCPTHGVKGRYY